MKPERHTSRLIRDWGASAGVEKDPGSLGFARDDTRTLGMTQEKGDTKKNLGAKWRPRRFAILTFHWVQGSPLPKEA
jgi:hypothetical protein